MLVERNINPERDLYYLGGVLIEIIRDNENEEFDYLELFEEFKNKYGVSINLFTLTLDWLFTLGIVTKGRKGKIKKCF